MAPKRRQAESASSKASPAAKRQAKPVDGHATAEGVAADNEQPSTSYAHFDAYLMKSEPEEFSIDALIAKPNGTGHWDGVRNAQARNIMRGMRVGDRVLFYHSSCKVPAVMAVAEVARTAYPDFSAWDTKSKYFDASSTQEQPKWWMVDIKFVRKLRRPVSLEEIRRAAAAEPRGALADMVLINRSRLSVQPVTDAQWAAIMALEQQEPAAAAPAEAPKAKAKAAAGKGKGKAGSGAADEAAAASSGAAGVDAAAAAASSKKGRGGKAAKARKGA